MILLWIILTNIALATLILCGMKLFEFLSRPADQDEDAFDRDPHHPVCRHARRPAEWEDFPQVNRVPQSGQASHEVAAPSHKVEPPALNELLNDGLSLDVALRLYDVGASIAREFAARRIPVETEEGLIVVNADLTMVSERGSTWNQEEAVYYFATMADEARSFLDRLDELLIDKNEERLSSLVRRDLGKPKTNHLWLVETGKLHSLYESRKWEDPYRRTHRPKPRKDKQGKSWQSFDGRHMNCRKLLADMIND